ncbi:hypothetical protein BTVI_60928 [Pitangus sulphuratus]|nr:hypothetical protein BTVI_60928 [Pitangus sulphuratus]
MSTVPWVKNAVQEQLGEKTRVEGEGGGVAGAEISLQPKKKNMVKQVVPLQPIEENMRPKIDTAPHGGPHATAGGHALEIAAAHGELIQQLTPGRSCGLWGGPMLHQIIPEECIHGKDPQWHSA